MKPMHSANNVTFMTMGLQNLPRVTNNMTQVSNSRLEKLWKIKHRPIRQIYNVKKIVDKYRTYLSL